MHHHIHLLHFLLNKELKELYVSMAIKSLAMAMVGIFIPAYLYLRTPAGLTGVAIFYLVMSLIHLFTSPWSAMLASRYGLKHALGISVPLYVLFYFLLAYHTTFNFTWIILLGIVMIKYFSMHSYIDAFWQSLGKCYRAAKIEISVRFSEAVWNHCPSQYYCLAFYLFPQ